MEREGMKILDLSLTYHWYDMIVSGEKKEEYREIKKYYESRLYDKEHSCYKHFDIVRFHKGYTSTALLVECKGIRIGRGKPEWGAPEDKPVFIISLGEIIQ